jgi:hypothetical protein
LAQIVYDLFGDYKIIRPLPPDELASIIHEACGDDNSTAMLTQVSIIWFAIERVD